MNIWDKIQSFLDIKSGTIVGLWSLGILAGCILSMVETHRVDAPIATCFCTVITCLAGTNIAKHLASKGNDTNVK